MIYFITIVAWLVAIGIAFLGGMFCGRRKRTDLVSREKIEKKAKKKKKEKENEIKDTPAADTGKYVSDETNESIGGSVKSGKDKALEALKRLSDRNRKRRNTAGE